LRSHFENQFSQKSLLPFANLHLLSTSTPIVGYWYFCCLALVRLLGVTVDVLPSAQWLGKTRALCYLCAQHCGTTMVFPHVSILAVADATEGFPPKHMGKTPQKQELLLL
jgi:hypothetical protein